MISEKIRKEINDHAHKNGWWDEYDLCKKLLLIVSEACEAMEADRRGKRCDVSEDALRMWDILPDEEFIISYEQHVKHTFQEELADIDIRTNDLAFESNVNMELYIMLKHRYNVLKGLDKNKKY